MHPCLFMGGESEFPSDFRRSIRFKTVGVGAIVPPCSDASLASVTHSGRRHVADRPACGAVDRPGMHGCVLVRDEAFPLGAVLREVAAHPSEHPRRRTVWSVWCDREPPKFKPVARECASARVVPQRHRVDSALMVSGESKLPRPALSHRQARVPNGIEMPRDGYGTPFADEGAR